jgi:hypothetical protein
MRSKLVVFAALAAALVASRHSLSAAAPFDRSVRTAENFDPAIPHPEQQQAVAQKLAALKGKFGKRPNIVWLVVDDMGYGDPPIH